ncbi:hypothetical protein BO83DRAFT_31333 [Aspergillus eucalypticola CBS 122712]|uniref:Uncharacterized protein n=1 Tax=Aspergillus eucalypticola (strain CBS 122712 / IBT 29274) TaxID=1448314 RepID=A0A317VG18_ASPEC|nr:uncharacterized protein BO83DRAFT_31333 [Aspergillus eucalypticola CBS 122712]PWY73306.1 hypothetical protein BO83DRAFT_31333 [Aspergillus eucalypticola CBS 122712]
MTEARLCTYVSVCRRLSGYCRRDAILPGASFSYAHFNTFPSFSLFCPGSFQEQLITNTNVYGNPQLAKYLPAFGWPTRSSFCYGTRHTCIFLHALIASWAWFLSNHDTLIYPRQGLSCLITLSHPCHSFHMTAQYTRADLSLSFLLTVIYSTRKRAQC